MLMLPLAAVLLASSGASAAVLPALSSAAKGHKVEIELRVALAASGFEKLTAALASSLAPALLRVDSYLDRHDGERFVLKRLDPPVKVRVKDDGGALKIQVSRPTAKDTVADGGLTATVTTVESRQSTLPREARELPRSLDAFFTALPGAAPVEALAAEAGRLMDGSSWEGKDIVEAAAPAARLLPAARSEKQRWRASIRLDDGTNLAAVLGQTRALDEQGRPVTLYELEAETDERDPEVLKVLARRLLTALRSRGLSSADLGGLTPDAFVFTESRLRGRR